MARTSRVSAPQRGATLHSTKLGLPPRACTTASILSCVGATTGRPSVQPRSAIGKPPSPLYDLRSPPPNIGRASNWLSGCAPGSRECTGSTHPPCIRHRRWASQDLCKSRRAGYVAGDARRACRTGIPADVDRRLTQTPKNSGGPSQPTCSLDAGRQSARAEDRRAPEATFHIVQSAKP